MKLILPMTATGLLVLFFLSVVLPPLPVWVGGLIGIAVFLAWGNLVARFLD